MDPVETIDKADALDAPPVPAATVPVVEKVRFLKTMGGGLPVPLGPDKAITFNVPVNNQTGDRCAWGWYETTDVDEIAALRKVVADQPWMNVEEVIPPQS